MISSAINKEVVTVTKNDPVLFGFGETAPDQPSSHEVTMKEIAECAGSHGVLVTKEGRLWHWVCGVDTPHMTYESTDGLVASYDQIESLYGIVEVDLSSLER